MVSIVLISHSRTLANGAADLARQICSDGVVVVPAGGTGDDRLGTSTVLIAAAVAFADRGDGVVLIPDMGSSVLSAKSLLPEFTESRVVLVDAPFVEGAVAAAIAASAGADLHAVVAAAEEARHVRKF